MRIFLKRFVIRSILFLLKLVIRKVFQNIYIYILCDDAILNYHEFGARQ